MGREEVAEFVYFYLFFGPAGFRGDETSRLPLVSRAVLLSSEYAVGVSDNLRERVFEALRLCIQGLLEMDGNGLSPETNMEECREQSFIFLYRLLFIMYAEDRGLLPYRRNAMYTRNRSLARQRDELLNRVHYNTTVVTPYFCANCRPGQGIFLPIGTTNDDAVPALPGARAPIGPRGIR